MQYLIVKCKSWHISIQELFQSLWFTFSLVSLSDSKEESCRIQIKFYWWYVFKIPFFIKILNAQIHTCNFFQAIHGFQLCSLFCMLLTNVKSLRFCLLLIQLAFLSLLIPSSDKIRPYNDSINCSAILKTCVSETIKKCLQSFTSLQGQRFKLMINMVLVSSHNCQYS